MKLNSISNLRVPLTLLVIFIHGSKGSGSITLGAECLDWPFTAWTIDYMLQQFISKILGNIAVPLFFLISGYLYFINFKQWDNKKYGQKLISRCWSLLLPYIIWNILYFFYWSLVVEKISPISAFIEKNGLSIFWDSGTWNDGVDLWGNTIIRHDPLFGHFWYIRDLFLFSLLSPIFYFAIKKLSYWWIALTTILFVFGFWHPNATINIIGLTFFSWGAILAMKKQKFNLDFCNKKILLSLSIVLMILALLIHEGSIYRITLNLFIIIVIICILHYTDKLNFDNRLWNKLSECTFFCYAVHKLVLPYTYSGKFCTWNDPFTDIAVYLIRPFLVYGILAALYFTLKKYTPRILKLLVGQRIQ